MSSVENLDIHRSNLKQGLSFDGTPLSEKRSTPCPMMNLILNHKLRNPQDSEGTSLKLAECMHAAMGVPLPVAEGWCNLVNPQSLSDLSKAHDSFPAGPGALVREDEDRTKINEELFEQLCQVAAFRQGISVKQLSTFTQEDLLTGSQLRIDQCAMGGFADNTARRAEMLLLFGLLANHPSCPVGSILVDQVRCFLLENRVPPDYDYETQGKAVPSVATAVASGTMSGFWASFRRESLANFHFVKQCESS